MMRASVSKERLEIIRQELGVTRFQAACVTRERHRANLIRAKRKLASAKRLLDANRRLNNPHGVSKWAGEVTFAETLVASIERRLSSQERIR